MKMRHRAASCIMALCMIFTLLGTGVPAARAAGETVQTGKTVEVYGIITEDQFDRIFNGTGTYNGYTTKDGDTIKLVGELAVDFKGNGDYPLVMRKKLTIEGQGNLIFMRAGGILLGADVTFRNVVLGFGNSYSNAIMANGYTLTLDNTTVSTQSGRGFAYAFCGGRVAGMDGTQGRGTKYSAPSGPHGQIIFKGNSHLGQPIENRTQGANYGAVFAGSYYDNWGGYNYYNSEGKVNGKDVDTTSKIPATIIFEKGYDPKDSKKIPHIYACGAWMERMNPNIGVYSVRNPARFDPYNCPVTDKVEVQLYGATVPHVDGRASANGNYASVTYNGDAFSDSATVIQNVGALDMKSGIFFPAGGSSFAPNADVTVRDGATLGFNYLGGAPAINNFTGGGSIVLGDNQALTINGTVSGTTEVGLGNIFNGVSLSYVANIDTVRIKTPNVAVGTGVFTFLPYPTQRLRFKNTDGDWSFEKDPDAKVLVETLELADVTAHSDSTDPEVTIPISATLVGADDVWALTGINVNQSIALKVGSSDSDEYHPCIDNYVTIGGTTYQVAYADDGNGDGICLSLYRVEADNLDWPLPLPENTTYKVKITISAESSATGKEIVAESTVTMVAQGATISITPPTDSHFPYTGSPIRGIPLNAGYVATGASEATAIGKHSATLTINTGYKWSDAANDTDTTRTVEWYIDKRPGMAIPDGTLRKEAPVPYSNNPNGKIIGISSSMEYAASADAQTWTSCGDNEMSIAPGTYFVRMKETDITLPGAATPVTVPEMPTLDHISVGVLPDKIAYRVNDPDTELDLSGMVLSRIMSDGINYPLPVTNEMIGQEITVTGFDTSAAKAALPLTVTYAGKTAEFDVAVKDDNSPNVKSINIKTYPKTEYRLSSTPPQLDLTGLEIEVVKEGNDGSETTELISGTSITSEMIKTDFDGTKPGTYTVTIEYWGASTNFTVTVKKAVGEDISLDGNTPDVVVQAPEPFVDNAMGKITAKRSDRVIQYAAAQNAPEAEWKVCPTGGTAVAPGTYWVRFAETDTQEAGAASEITVKAAPVLAGITISNYKTEYAVGETIDLSNTMLARTVKDGDTVLGGSYPLPLNNDMIGEEITVEDFDTSKAAADVPVTLKYTYKGTTVSTTFNITVTGGNTPEKQPGVAITERLTATAPVPYSGDEKGTISGITTAMEYREENAQTWISCEGGALQLLPGTYLVRYKETTTTKAGPAREVIVPAMPTLVSISVESLPTKMAYDVGDTVDQVDLTGIVLARVMSDGETYPTDADDVKDITVKADTFITTEAKADLPVTVVYEGKEASFEISVLGEDSPRVTSIRVIDGDYKKAYRVGETLNFDKLNIEVTEEKDGKTVTSNVPVTAEMVTPKSLPTAAGTHNMTIVYWGKSTTYQITVEGRRHVTVKGEGNVSGLDTDGYFKGDTVTLTAQARSGYTFDKWEAAGLTLAAADAVKQTLSFTMPDNDVTLTMNWKQNTQTPPSSGGGGGGGAVIVPPANNAVSTGSESGADGTAQTVTTVRPSVSANGTSATVDTAMAQEMVKQVKDTSGDAVRLAPEMKDDVTKAEVSVPASALQTLGKETKASLTVVLPVAEISIGNTSLEQIGKSGGTVTIGAERDGSALTLTVQSGGSPVTEIGVTVTVPYKDATDSTVAVLVAGDGTRTVVRKTAVQDGALRLPLTGGAKIEMVDNRKEFHDMGNAGWAQSAVTFVSSREILSGTGNGRFDPSMTMTRSMLVQALYNLEGSPAVSAQGRFDDVEHGAWYNDAVHWAADKGIVTGYGNGAFGVSDPITREQLAVILWRYSGSPAVDTHTGLTFHDAHLISSYGQDAMHWAVARGVLSGKGNGTLDPRGQASRAEVAQMLKNFMQIRL